MDARAVGWRILVPDEAVYQVPAQTMVVWYKACKWNMEAKVALWGRPLSGGITCSRSNNHPRSDAMPRYTSSRKNQKRCRCN